ncbi:hypothetical protein SK128_027044, partial [Halocaridina rubra]
MQLNIIVHRYVGSCKFLGTPKTKLATPVDVLQVTMRPYLVIVTLLMVAWTLVQAKDPPPDPNEPLKDPCENPAKLSQRKRNTCHAQALLSMAQKGKYKQIKKQLKLPDTAYLVTFSESTGWRKGYTALLWSAEKNCTRCMELLLNAGSVVNHQSHNFMTALYLVVESGNEHCVDLLLAKGANPNIRTRK